MNGIGKLMTNNIIPRTLANEDTYVVVINLGNEGETVDLRNKFDELPDGLKIHIASENSQHMAG